MAGVLIGTGCVFVWMATSAAGNPRLSGKVHGGEALPSCDIWSFHHARQSRGELEEAPRRWALDMHKFLLLARP